MAERLRGPRWLATVMVMALTLVLAGCGLGESGGPADEGDGLAGGVSVADSEVRNPPPPDSASTAAGLVTDFLRAASGGQRPATDRVKAFLTENALQSWRDLNPDNPQLTIIRVVGGPSDAQVPDTRGRTPVTVNYLTVGTLTDEGRVDGVKEQPGTMTVWVVPDRNPSNLRVDEIVGAPEMPGLMLSDDALTEFYRIQPVYFWDQSYSALVPDLRYLPLTITPDLRANRVVQWLVAGPSPWLVGAQPLLLGTAPEQVVTENGKLVVRFNGEVAPSGPERPESLRRLLFQLQWSLRTSTTPALELRIDNKVETIPVNVDDYLPFNLSSTYRTSGQRYDISAEQKVVTNPASPAAQGVLGAPENQNVVAAAIAGGGTIAAYVRADVAGRGYLQIVREGGAKLDIELTHSFTMRRPVFVSPSGGHLLITSSGRLYAVSTADGGVSDVTGTVGGVTAVSVSPDGRRVALVANNQVWVSSLSLAGNEITIGPILRPILSGQIAATAVAWTNEVWLDVVGTNAQGSPALWRVTADSVVAQNLSDSLLGATVTDIVAYPHWPARTISDVFVMTDQEVYTYFTSLTPEPTLNAPFFGT